MSNRCAVVVSMSSFETHPLSALEAAAAGRPLVVADSSGLRELADQGLARTVALRSSPEELAKAIVAELENPISVVPVKLPSWDDCAVQLLELYREVACAS